MVYAHKGKLHCSEDTRAQLARAMWMDQTHNLERKRPDRKMYTVWLHLREIQGQAKPFWRIEIRMGALLGGVMTGRG